MQGGPWSDTRRHCWQRHWTTWVNHLMAISVGLRLAGTVVVLSVWGSKKHL
jgi:hypothetical protein